jgi:geranyl-CoA carboxylase alpha subunit
MQEPGVLHASFEGRNLIFRNQIAFAASAAEQAGGGRVTAPMHGAVLEVFVATGDTVKRGDRLAVVEAMKMQHDILAEIDGIVQDVATSVGSQVAADDLLVEIEAA